MSQFELMYSEHDAEMLNDAYDAITKCNLWDWFREFEPHANEGFMFTSHPNLDILHSNLKYTGHSGASFAMTMRVMQLVARSGRWDGYLQAYKDKWPKERPVCSCRSARGLKLGWCGVAGGGVPGCEH